MEYLDTIHSMLQTNSQSSTVTNCVAATTPTLRGKGGRSKKHAQADKDAGADGYAGAHARSHRGSGGESGSNENGRSVRDLRAVSPDEGGYG